MDKLDLEQFKEMNPCPEGYRFVLDLKTTDIGTIFSELLNQKPRWANWLIVRLLNRKNRIRYAVFAARRVLPIFEDKYRDDNRPRLAIEAAEKCIEHDTPENIAVAKSAAYAVEYAAESAVRYATFAVESAAYAVEYAVADAESAVRYAAESAVRYAAKSAAFAVEYAAESAVRYATFAVESATDAVESAAYVEAHSATSAEYAAYAESTWLVEMAEIVKYGLELLKEQ